MKNLYLILFLSCFLVACGLKEEGKISVENGEGKSVRIPYEFYQYKDFLNDGHTEGDFNEIVRKSTSEAMNQCIYKLTFVPTKILFVYDKKNISTILYFQSKNGFGVPEEMRCLTYFQGITFVESGVTRN